jgi:hypothetical protein
LIHPKSQSQLEQLCQLHILDKVEDDKTWECVKILKYSEEKDLINSVQHKCLVESNDLNKSQSWVNFFALCLSNPTPAISFAIENNLLDKNPFCHPIPYCKVKPPLNIAKVHKVTSSPTAVNYKFGIQVPKEIKNAISLDKKNKNYLWQEAIETELKQLTSAARFDEHLAESLQRLDFKKTKHDPELWMLDKTSHYEYLATYVGDILIWSKDPMAVIKSLEKIYLLKNVGIPEYYLGGNVEFLEETWKNQRLRLAISSKTYIQNVIPKFEGLLIEN